MNDAELAGGLIGAVIFALLVALLAKNKSIGYGGGVAIALILNIICVLLLIPFDFLIGTAVSALIFILLPKKPATP